MEIEAGEFEVIIPILLDMPGSFGGEEREKIQGSILALHNLASLEIKEDRKIGALIPILHETPGSFEDDEERDGKVKVGFQSFTTLRLWR